MWNSAPRTETQTTTHDPMSPDERAAQHREAERRDAARQREEDLNDVAAFSDLQAALERVGKTQEFEQYMHRLAMFEGRAWLLVKHPADDVNDLTPVEMRYTISDGVRCLALANNPEQKWRDRFPKPVPNPAQVRMEFLYAQRVKWQRLSPLARSLYTAAQTSPHRDLLVAIASGVDTYTTADGVTDAVLDLIK